MTRKNDLNQIIAILEDAKTSIEEAQIEDQEQQRELLLDDAITSIDEATDELEESDLTEKSA